MNHDNKPKLLNRLRRIEGQVRGVVKMVEDNRYCVDVLTQIQALKAALKSVEGEILKDHVDHCVHDAFTTGNAADQRQKTDELVKLLLQASR